MHMSACTRQHTHTHTHIQTHTHKHTQTHTYKHTHTNTHTHIRTCTHTDICTKEIIRNQVCTEPRLIYQFKNYRIVAILSEKTAAKLLYCRSIIGGYGHNTRLLYKLHRQLGL